MIKIYPTVFNGTLRAPASKAHAQRLLLASSLPTSFTLIKNVPKCEDIYTTMECLEAFGSRLSVNEHGDIIVEPFPKTVPVPTAYFNFKQSGTTSRIAIAIAAALAFRVDASADLSLTKRQFLPLASRLAIRGVSFTAFTFPFSMKGRLMGGEYVFRGDEGDEFISALLMALPLVRDDSTIRLESPLIDSSLIDLTIDTLDKFGIGIERAENGYDIKGMQQYESPGTIIAENDWAISSMLVAAGASSSSKGGRVKITGLQQNSPQIYRNIKPYLSLIAQDFRDVSLNACDCPEFATLFASMALLKGGSFKINGVPQLKHMETDRFKTIYSLAETLNAGCEISESEIYVYSKDGVNYSDDVILDCLDDPYVFMSLALSAGVMPKPITIKDEHCIDKIYTDFLKDYKAIGGKFDIIGG